MDMRILVTGADGFFGRHVVAGLPRTQSTILHCGFPGSVKMYRSRGFSDVHTGDLAGGPAVRGLPDRDVDTVVHLAGLPGGEEEELLRANVAVTKNLLAWARTHSVSRIVFASTAAVYGDSCDRDATELDDLNPQTPYSVSKVAAEGLLKEYVTDGGAVASLRIPHAYGAGKREGVFAAILGRTISGDAISLDGDGEEKRDFVYIDDVVSAFLAACDARLSDGFHAYNIGYGESLSLRDACRVVAGVVGRDVEVGLTGQPAGKPHCIQIDVSRAKSELAWVPRVNLENGVRRMLGDVGRGE